MVLLKITQFSALFLRSISSLLQWQRGGAPFVGQNGVADKKSQSLLMNFSVIEQSWRNETGVQWESKLLFKRQLRNHQDFHVLILLGNKWMRKVCPYLRQHIGKSGLANKMVEGSKNGSLVFTGESLGGCNNLTSIGNVQGVEYVQTPLSSEQSSKRASVSARLILPQNLLWDKLIDQFSHASKPWLHQNSQKCVSAGGLAGRVSVRGSFGSESRGFAFCFFCCPDIS